MLAITKYFKRCKLAIRNKPGELVMSFKYRGVHITSSRYLQKEVKAQTTKAAGYLKSIIWRKTSMSIKTEVCEYKPCVRPAADLRCRYKKLGIHHPRSNCETVEDKADALQKERRWKFGNLNFWNSTRNYKHGFKIFVFHFETTGMPNILMSSYGQSPANFLNKPTVPFHWLFPY